MSERNFRYGVCVRMAALIAVLTVVVAGCAAAPRELIQAAKDGDVQAVRAALSAGADVNARVKDGVTALMMASYNGHRQIVKLLLDMALRSTPEPRSA